MPEYSAHTQSNFTPFPAEAETIVLPQKFTYPFNYIPHPLTKMAVEEVRKRLETEHLGYHYGLTGKKGYGKMFGVLVVKNTSGKLGYLAAFSGKMGDKSRLPGFVPPVYDRLSDDGFFLPEEKEISLLNKEIEDLKGSAEYRQLKERLKTLKSQSEFEISQSLQAKKEAKERRDQKRKMSTLYGQEQKDFEALLEKESKDYHFNHRRLNKEWKERIKKAENELQVFTDKISSLKQERKKRSASLQQQLFNQYQLLNAKKEAKGLCDIFEDFSGTLPPAGAGDCAAPKLLQYAYSHDLKPVCMAEFWWGASPVQEIRKHGHFYPACRGKCEPILNHMLKGLAVDPNPSALKPTNENNIEILFEDGHLLVVNKPENLLSVPGKIRKDSVQTRIQQDYPEAMLVHRLDMATSGMLLIAKNETVYKKLQQQFLDHRVKKRYIALLEGNINKKEGFINLPLRVDLDNRPHQMVCHDHGKPAQTRYEVIEKHKNNTLVYFYPITGRTHQLRVHAAHQHGLNNPIVGDDLYGLPADRLYLHAERLSFFHPETEEPLTLTSPSPFSL